MKADMLLDVIGNVEDAYIISAQNRLEALSHSRGGYRRILAAAAAIFIVLLSSFTAAMAANEDFRNAVFQFFHISEPVEVPPLEEDVDGQETIEIVGSMLVEDAIKVEYIRAKGSYGHSFFGGAVCVNNAETGESGVYAIREGRLSRLDAHREDFSYVWKDMEYEISFDWYINNGVICTSAGNFDLDTSAAWEVQPIRGNSEFVIITLSYGAQIEYTCYPLLYNLKTHETVDVLEACEEIKDRNIIEAEFSGDLSKVLLTCGEAVMWYDENSSEVYCYDIEKQDLLSLSELCGMKVMEAWCIDRDTVGCLWYDEDFNYTLRTLTLSSGEYFEGFTDMPGLDWSQDNTGISFNSKRYGLLVAEGGSISVYDFKTGETLPVEGLEYSEEFSAGSFSQDGIKLLFSETTVGENVWVTRIGILDLEKRTFISFEREGSGAPREYSIGWFDSERVGIEANTGEYWYLYLFSADEIVGTAEE